MRSQRADSNVLVFDNFRFPLAAAIFASRAAESYRCSARVIPRSKQSRGLREYAVVVVGADDAKLAKSLKLTVKAHGGAWRRDLPLADA